MTSANSREDLAIRKGQWIGKSVKRVEDPRFLTGAARACQLKKRERGVKPPDRIYKA